MLSMKQCASSISPHQHRVLTACVYSPHLPHLAYDPGFPRVFTAVYTRTRPITRARHRPYHVLYLHLVLPLDIARRVWAP